MRRDDRGRRILLAGRLACPAWLAWSVAPPYSVSRLPSLPGSRRQHWRLLRRIGYRELTQLVHVPAGDTTRISFFLTPAATTLDTVSVVAEAVSRSPRLAGFERRRQQHIGGAFITRAEIERRNAIATSQLLLNMLGVRVVDSAGVKLLASARGYKVVFGRTSQIAPCMMAVGVDGQIKEWGYPV